MARYIAVGDALNAMCECCDADKAVCSHYPCKLHDAVECTPSADVRENIHSHWEDWSFLGWDMETHWRRRCSNCLCEREDDNEEKDTPFCPNCGAVMDERGE